MSGLAAVPALAVTLVALGWLTVTDPKRRRAFRRPTFTGRRRVAVAWMVVLLPGVLLLATGEAAGFLIWMGAASVAGWAMAAIPPARAARIRRSLDRPLRRARSAIAALAGLLERLRPVPAYAVDRIDALERRVAMLEAALGGRAAGGRRNGPGPMRLADHPGARAARAGER